MTIMPNNVTTISKGKPKNAISIELLKSLDVPNGKSVAIYDRLSRKALFYRNDNGRFIKVLVRDKRGALIMHRDDDMIISLDFNGAVIPGDPFHAFISESENLRRVRERSCINF